MNYQFTNDKPIYLQLMDAFKTGIASGELEPGTRLDSVRDLAMRAKVNPNTMQKALSELEREELVYTERTAGRFITRDQVLINRVKNEMAQILIADFTEKMRSLGFDKVSIIKLLEEKDKYPDISQQKLLVVE